MATILITGCGPCGSLIADTIEDYIALQLLDDKYHPGDILQVGAKHNELTYTTAVESVSA